ncbi:glycosyltransferase family 2 protein [Microbacterium tumbae]
MRISVVIPVRDDAPMLERCLAALAVQRRTPDEIVVVDNASSDGSAAIAAAAGARVVFEAIPGIPRASAAGYDTATGDVIARLDADSRPAPDWLERIDAAFRGTDLDFLTGEPRFYGGSAFVRWAGRHLYIGGMYAVLTPLLGHPPLFGSNMAMRTAAWRMLSDEVHRDRTDIHDDFDLSLHIRPGMTVRRDRQLIVDVSARPFDSWRSLRRRLSWVLPTVRLHWPADAPGRRRAARRAVASRDDRGRSSAAEAPR